jgi:hypothetical protein
MATQDSPNLYERLGGVYSIATVVDDLIDRVMVGRNSWCKRSTVWQARTCQ